MADKEISELTAATTPLAGDELIHIDQDGNSRKVAVSEIAGLVSGAMLKATYDPNDDGVIAVANGGTGAATASGARTNLGLGTMAVQNAASVAITGGSVTGITDLAVADGGTGASTAADARTNLGLAIGSDVQAYLGAGADGQVLKWTGGAPAWGSVVGTGDMLGANNLSELTNTATARANLGLTIGAHVQAYSANLDAWSALSTSAKQDASPNLTTLAGITPGAAGQAILADATAQDVKDYLDIQTSDVEFVNGKGSGYIARALDNVIGEGNTRLRDALGDAATPTAAEWVTALQKCHDDLKSTTGSVWFSEPITLNAPIDWDGFVSLRGTGRTLIHRFAHSEPYAGAIILGSNGLDLGNDADYTLPNGFINVKLDTSILANISSRPRANIFFENFGIYGNQMSVGSGIRVFGTMYVTMRDLNLAWLPTWGITTGSRADISPGSPNGCRLEDVLVTSCGTAGSGGGIQWVSPDSHLENIQAGGNAGIGVYFNSSSNVTAEQIQAWNNDEDNIRIASTLRLDLHCQAYDGDKTNLAIMGTSREISVRGQLWHPNRNAQTAARDSTNLYIESTVEDVNIDVRASGETYAQRYSQYNAWVTATAYTAGDIVVNANKRYTAASTGTSGGTAPTHTSGTVSDGGVDWTFDHGYGLYGIYSDGASNVIHNNGVFRNHRTQDYYMRSGNISGATGGRHRMTASTTPAALFSAADEDGVWKVRCTRVGSSQDYIEATVIGGSTPVIILEEENGTGFDLAVSGSNITLAYTSTVTALCFWRKEL